MGDKDKLFDSPLIIRFRGQYDYDGLISLLRGFFKRAKMPIKEPKFKYKVGGTGAEIEFKFKGDLKVTHYIKVFLNIDGKGYDVKPKEVVVKGKKKKMTDGKIELKFQGEFELDYPGMYDEDKQNSRLKNKMLVKMKDFMDNKAKGISFGDNKALGKKNIQKMVMKFHAETKEFLGMKCV